MTNIKPFVLEVTDAQTVSDAVQALQLHLEKSSRMCVQQPGKIVLLADGRVLEQDMPIEDEVDDNMEVYALIYQDKRHIVAKGEKDTPAHERKFLSNASYQKVPYATPGNEQTMSESPVPLPFSNLLNREPAQPEHVQSAGEVYPMEYITLLEKEQTQGLIARNTLQTPVNQGALNLRLLQRLNHAKTRYGRTLRILREVGFSLSDDLMVAVAALHRGDLELIIQHLNKLMSSNC